MLDVIITAFLSFVSTNIDDIFILMLLFTQATKRKEKIKITMGQYLGISVLVVLSLVGALASRVIPQQYIRFLGLVPIALGAKAWLDNRKAIRQSEASCEKTDEECDQSDQIPTNNVIQITSVMSLTIANGADNIGVYIPVFSRYNYLAMLILMIVFVVMTGIWCMIGNRLASLPIIKKAIQKYQHIVVPVVLIGLGVYILLA